ncbi:DNA ligase 1-like [Phymastichus coffea]|uniref:DNA ligase 1-like n=1 Tax=Phymastichus coffea TaxID=108790 RepID=UPI00273BF758|nr:DNA ligase 1-like [Phymastichus coffea]
MSKRKLVSSQIEKLKKRKDDLELQLGKLKEAQDELSIEDFVDDDNSESESSYDEEDEEDEEHFEDEQRTDDTKRSETQSSGAELNADKAGSNKHEANQEQEVSDITEKPLQAFVTKSLGEHPNKSKAKEVVIHSELISYWQHYAIEGLDKEERDQAIKKYNIPKALEAPIFNEPLQADEIEGVDLEGFVEKLVDAAKLLSEIQHKESETRRAYIAPQFTKQFQALLKKAEPDEQLFGKELSTKMKEFKDSDKLFKDVTKPNKFKTPMAKTGNGKRSTESRP